MSGRAGPGPPSGAGPGAYTGGRVELATTGMFVDDGLVGHDQRRVDRMRLTLLLVPYSFPRWYALRSDRPDLAELLWWPLVVNVAQSVLIPVIVLAAMWAFLTLPAIAGRMATEWFAR